MSAVDSLKSLVPLLGTYASPQDFAHLSDAELAGAGIKSVNFIGSTNQGERRWGFDQQTVFEVDGALVGIWCYVTTGDGEQDEPSSWEFYPVEARQSVEYVKVREPKVEKPVSEADLSVDLADW